jgi:hypothetical protein
MVTIMDTTPETVEVPAAGSVFSLDDDLSALWVKAYQGEVSGEALFGGIGARTDDPDHRRKWEVLRVLEARTREACVEAMERHGLPTEPDPEVVSASEAQAEAGAALAWADLMGFFEPITTEFLAVYRRIGELSETDRAESDLLVAHEEALREFARRELAGRTDDSLELIEALPHMS